MTDLSYEVGNISMLIIIQMYSKLKRVHTTNYVYLFF